MPLSDCLPFGGLGRTPLLQTLYTELTSDRSTTSTAFVDLLTLSATTSGGVCVLIFTVGGSNASTNTNVRFQLLLDGVVLRGTKFRRDGGAGSPASLVYTASPSPGAHVFKVQWSVSAGTGRIRAGTVVEEHAGLSLEEITR